MHVCPTKELSGSLEDPATSFLDSPAGTVGSPGKHFVAWTISQSKAYRRDNRGPARTRSHRVSTPRHRHKDLLDPSNWWNVTKTLALWAFSLSLWLLGLRWQWGSAQVLGGYMPRYSKETLIPGVPLPLVLVLSMPALAHLRVSEQALPSARSAHFPDYPQLSPCHSAHKSPPQRSQLWPLDLHFCPIPKHSPVPVPPHPSSAETWVISDMILFIYLPI